MISIQFVVGDTLHRLLVDLRQLLLIKVLLLLLFFCVLLKLCHMFYFILFNFNLLLLWQ